MPKQKSKKKAMTDGEATGAYATGGSLKRVLVVDNGTQYMGALYGKLESHASGKAKVDKVDVKDVRSKKDLSGYDAVILSGSSHRGYNNTTHRHILDNVADDAYVIGVCHGHQSLAHLHGSKIEKLHDNEFQSGYHKIKVTRDNEAFGKKGDELEVFKKHQYGVTKLGDNLEAIAVGTPKDKQGRNYIKGGKPVEIIEAFKHRSKNIYGIQGHPEKGGHGEQVLYKLLTQVYG